MEGVVIFTVILVAIVAGIYTIVDTWNSAPYPGEKDKDDLD